MASEAYGQQVVSWLLLLGRRRIGGLDDYFVELSYEFWNWCLGIWVFSCLDKLGRLSANNEHAGNCLVVERGGLAVLADNVRGT